MTEGTPPQPRPHDRIIGLWKLAGLGALTFLAISGLVTYWATIKMIDRANTRVADLLARVGVAEDKASQLEKQVAADDQLIQRLQKVDVAKVTAVLNAAESSQTLRLIEGRDFTQRYERLWEHVADVYAFAHWSAEQGQYRNSNFLRDCLAHSYEDFSDLRSLLPPRATLEATRDIYSMNFDTIKLYADTNRPLNPILDDVRFMPEKNFAERKWEQAYRLAATHPAIGR